MTSFRKITCVIYDMDGLLLDTEPFYTAATREIASRYGKEYDYSLKSELIGKTSMDSAKIVVEKLALPITPETYIEERNVLLDESCPSAEALPGAVKLTSHLFKHKIPQAVASSSSRHSFELKITRHREWFSIFNCIVLADDPGIENGKPAPDLFLKAAELMEVDPKSCLVFEDAPAGMEAALIAGMSVVVVPDSNVDKAVFKDAGQILNSLEDFNLQQWQLPPFLENR
ncbi:MAG: HAD-IA family hydrolase [SAR324 cluster bacterium]|nr:HAD-IA family hydrolase [SAR324 cluster bacterium]